MLTVVIVLTLAGSGLGYVIAASALTDSRRERIERRRDLYRAALHDELDDLDPPFGLIDGDTDTIDIAAPTPRRWRWGWRWAYLQTCATCAGTWGVIGVYAVWLAGAAVDGRTIEAADVAPTLAAGIGGQLLLTMGAMRAGLWGADVE